MVTRLLASVTFGLALLASGCGGRPHHSGDVHDSLESWWNSLDPDGLKHNCIAAFEQGVSEYTISGDTLTLTKRDSGVREVSIRVTPALANQRPLYGSWRRSAVTDQGVHEVRTMTFGPSNVELAVACTSDHGNLTITIAAAAAISDTTIAILKPGYVRDRF